MSMQNLLSEDAVQRLRRQAKLQADRVKQMQRSRAVRWMLSGNWVWFLGALMVAGIIHIIAALSLPMLAPDPVLSKMSRVTSVNTLYIIRPTSTLQDPIIPFLAPDIRYAFCRYNLNDGPLLVRAPLPEAPWSIAISTPHADNFYTVTGAELRRQTIQLLIATSAQFTEAEKAAAESSEEIVVVKAPTRQGVVLVRAPLTSLAYRDSTDRLLQTARCQPAALNR